MPDDPLGRAVNDPINRVQDRTVVSLAAPGYTPTTACVMPPSPALQHRQSREEAEPRPPNVRLSRNASPAPPPIANARAAVCVAHNVEAIVSESLQFRAQQGRRDGGLDLHSRQRVYGSQAIVVAGCVRSGASSGGSVQMGGAGYGSP